ncbi:TRAP transporter permease [Chloroflexota bacterium]
MAKETKVGTNRIDNLPTPAKLYFYITTVLGIGLAVYYIFGFHVNGYVFLNKAYYFLLFAVFGTIAFLIIPARKGIKKLPWYDILAAASMLGLCLYCFVNAADMVDVGWVPAPSVTAIVLASIFVVLILEGARRIAGPIFVAVCVIIGIYPLFCGIMPGAFQCVNYPILRAIASYIYGGEGIAGLMGMVLGDLIIGFLIFAALLIASGAGQFFLDMAMALLGGYRGGAAKVAVLSSAFFASLSGSSLSNVVATGSVTIPTMKRIGYPPEYAGAIEACASMAGPVTPPVMGGGAFIMCLLLNKPYAFVMVAAAIPAILFYFGLMMQVDAYAAKTNMKGLPRAELPSVLGTLKWGWHIVVVLVFLVWGLVIMQWGYRTPFYASGLLLLLSFTSRRLMMTPRRLLNSIVEVGKLLGTIAPIFLPLGIIMAALAQSGVSSAIIATVVSLGGSNVAFILLLGIIMCYLMGMAGISGAAWLIMAVTLVPAVVEVGGLNHMAVLLFVSYYTMLSVITPPVAAVAFVGASIAGANPLKTAWRAVRLGIVIYFVPFFFVFEPALILQGAVLDSIRYIILCFIGIVFLAGGVEGYILRLGRINWWTRLGFIVGGFAIGFPEMYSTYGGAILVGSIVAIILLGRSRGRLALKTGQ